MHAGDTDCHVAAEEPARRAAAGLMLVSSAACMALANDAPPVVG